MQIYVIRRTLALTIALAHYWIALCDRCVCVNVCVSGFGRFLTLLSSVFYLCCFIVKNSVHKTPFGCKQRKHRIEVNGRDNMHTPKKHTNHFYFLSACVLSVFICCGWLFPVVNPIVIYTELVSSSLTAHWSETVHESFTHLLFWDMMSVCS